MIAGLPQKIGRFSGGARAISKIAEEGISYLFPREGACYAMRGYRMANHSFLRFHITGSYFSFW
jgi:hypothetical protein